MLQCSGKIYSIFVGRRNGLKRWGEKYILFLILGEFALKIMVKILLLYF